MPALRRQLLHYSTRVGLLIAVATLLNSCLIWPFPWPAHEPRVGEEQIQSLTPSMDRAAVDDLLGEPDLRREHDRLWIYGSERYSGLWLVLLGYSAAGGPMRYERNILFLQFDEHGTLAASSSAHGGGSAHRFCSDSGLCVRTATPYVGERLLDAQTAVFRKDDFPDPTPPSPDTCRLLIVFDEKSGLPSGGSERDTAAFRIDALWSGFTILVVRETVASADLVPGNHHVYTQSAQAPLLDAPFECPAGQTVAFRLRFRYSWNPFASAARALELTPLTDSELALAAATPRLMLPDNSAPTPINQE